MARTTLAFDKAEKLLEDGEWHDFEPIVVAVAKAVPPGLAYRAAEANRGRALKKHGTLPPSWKQGDPLPPRVRQMSEEAVIRSGQRFLAHKTLRNDRFEHQRDGGRHLIRLRPVQEISLEERRARYRKGQETRKRKGIDNSEASRKGAQTAREKYGDDWRSKKSKEAMDRITPEERSNRSKRAWETRNKKSVDGLAKTFTEAFSAPAVLEEPGQTYQTPTGKVLTESDIEALADEAERGYDTATLVRQERDARTAHLSGDA